MTLHPSTASSHTPTEYTSDFGEFIKVPSSPPRPDETTVTEWEYRGEGKAHIIFGYVGLNTFYRGKAIRIKKQLNEKEEEVEKVWKKELRRLIDPQYLLREKKVVVRREWVKDVLKRAEGRSEKRKAEWDGGVFEVNKEGEMEVDLVDDLRTGVGEVEQGEKVVVIEIKPKWGFLPNPQHIHPAEAAPIKSQNCRFCMHQYLRDPTLIHQGRYCPIDLFSGDEVKMQKALEGLVKLWKSTGGVGNNWRMFVGQEIINPGDLSKLVSNTPESLLPHITRLLKSTEVLNLLKSLQMAFDPTDISALAQQYRIEFPESELFDPSNIPDPTAEEIKDLVDLLLSDPSRRLHAPQSTDSPSPPTTLRTPAIVAPIHEKWTFRQRCVAYGLSAIFKDCSIFLTLHLIDNPQSDGSETWSLVEDKSSLKIIDLDLKPLSLKKWYDLDHSIWSNWCD
ncbi:hypothetical protein TREMEDRAFT_24841, partial [Tremella mesenterica DSM 1558]|uniref:uncharacterized protein n=1 Tax=Tremella mesenterica (strain ATCC 24925 / CBS 8224 / DSM 1558 / NBRC 9311 / NRRL Y-6157 / RJB 2259-6 / UBC 559-6) TaxID=578456 RepID=UPI0003F49377